MKERFSQYKDTFYTFAETIYYTDFLHKLTIFLILWLFHIALWLTMLSEERIFSHGLTVSSVLLLLETLIGFAVSTAYWVFYYRTVIVTAIKIETIKQKYALIHAEQMTDYVSSLQVILNLIDSSLEREYSNRLLQKQAEFDAMRSQINPHFLYNTLDTIRGYALMEEAPLTSDMIEVLSRLFRYMISQKNEMIALRQELNILYDYIKIQEYRINQHIVFLQKIESDLDIMEYEIPKLIIQPFIENAIKHGLKGITKDFIITLAIYRTQSRLIISISDNGCGITPTLLKDLNRRLSSDMQHSIHEIADPPKSSGTGIAITNVSARIRLLYGDSFGVIAHSTLGKGSEFQISLPLHINRHEG